MPLGSIPITWDAVGAWSHGAISQLTPCTFSLFIHPVPFCLRFFLSYIPRSFPLNPWTYLKLFCPLFSFIAIWKFPAPNETLHLLSLVMHGRWALLEESMQLAGWVPLVCGPLPCAWQTWTQFSRELTFFSFLKSLITSISLTFS